MSTVLLDSTLTEEQLKQVQTIRTGAKELVAVINDILDFSKIDSGKFDLEESLFDLRSCIDSAIDLIDASAASKAIEVIRDIRPEVPQAIVGDVTRLRQVLVNLLGNAVKFTSGGSITLRAKATELDGQQWEVEFQVADTGIGIPKDRLRDLFQPFQQLDASTTRRYGGTGLGLAISYQLAEQMGGRMWVESDPGVGSTFFFTILAKSIPQIAPEEYAASEQINRKRDIGVDKTFAIRYPFRILVVDDHPVNQQVAVLLLSRLGYNADVAGNGLEALQALRRQRYDVVFMDMQMPEMGGVEASRVIQRNWPEEQRPWIIALTANAMQSDREECLRAGMQDFVSKPIEASDLREALERVHKYCSLLSVPAVVTRTDTAWAIPESLGLVFSDDPDLARELVEMFRSDMKQRLTLCWKALQSEDAAELKKLMHGAKGSSRQMGAGQMAELAAEMERNATAGQLATIGDQLRSFERAFSILQKAIGEMFDKAPVESMPTGR
jgi:CheY-like chemotaxis protein/HPt (histidine-containing phosphotransfer) domain-containing protein